MSGGGWDLDEIRRRADIVELVSPHVRLRKAGRRLVGLCPFHQERTPSFTVDPETGLWYCFGCKAGGDLFRFVEMIEKVDFQEAVEILARRYNIQPRRPRDAARQRAKDRLLALHEQVAELFRKALWARRGESALAYLRGRGLSDETIRDFGLGYAPDSWDALLKTMAKRGFAGDELARAGLAVPREGGFYDRFRDRVIFPIRDVSGRVIAFGGRALSEEKGPKYLNSPETALFQKGQTLWGLDRARQAMTDAGRAIIVEGYLDAIACHEVGFREAVATMGTALTAEHVEMLRRRVERLVLAFDSDSAGLAAALRGRELFERAGLEVLVATLPEGQDPDDVVRQGGEQAFSRIVEAAAPMVEWELRRVLGPAEEQGERERMGALREAIGVLARVPGGVEREYYIRWLAQEWGGGDPRRLSNAEAAIRDELGRQAARRGRESRRTDSAPSGERDAGESAHGRRVSGGLHELLLAALLRHGELAARCVEELSGEDFPDPTQREIFTAIQALVGRGEEVNAREVLASVGPEAAAALAGLALRGVPEERVQESVESGVQRLIEARLRRRQTDLQRRYQEAASEEERDAVNRELKDVQGRRHKLAGQRIVEDE